MVAIQRATSLLEKNVLKRIFFFFGRVTVSSSLYKFDFLPLDMDFYHFFRYEVHKKDVRIFRSNG